MDRRGLLEHAGDLGWQQYTPSMTAVSQSPFPLLSDKTIQQPLQASHLNGCCCPSVIWAGHDACLSPFSAGQPRSPGHVAALKYRPYVAADEQCKSIWTLQPLALGVADDQYLFELCIRLQYSFEERIVLPALCELKGVLVLDFPVECLLQRCTLLDKLLLLLASSGVREDVQDAAARVLQELVHSMKRALHAQMDEEMAPVQNNHSRDQPDVAVDNHREGCGYPPLADSFLQENSIDVGRATQALLLCVCELLRHPARHSVLLPLVQELLPLALSPQPQPQRQLHLGRGTAFRAELLRALSLSLEACASLAQAHAMVLARGASQGAQVGDVFSNVEHREALLLDAACMRVIDVALSVLQDVPAEDAAGLVPLLLVDVLARAYTDELMAVLLPGLRPAALSLLSAVRPDAVQLLRQAELVEEAVAASSEVAQQLGALQRGTLAAPAWLQQLDKAATAMGYSSEGGQLLAAALAGLTSIVHQAAGAADAGQAGRALMALQTHRLLAVRCDLLALLADHVKQEPEQAALSTAGIDALALAGLPVMTEFLVVTGLAFEAVRAHAAKLLLALLQRGSESQRQGVLQWSAWLDSYAGRPDEAGMVASVADSLLQEQQLLWQRQCSSTSQQRQQSWTHEQAVAAMPPWWLLSRMVRGLYCASAAARQQAAKHLAAALWPGASGWQPLDVVDGDPFKGMLQPRDVPAGDDAWSSSRGFSTEDVRNLLGVVARNTLAPELRRSAVEQLQALARDAELLHSVSSAEALTTLVQLAHTSMGIGSHSKEQKNALGGPIAALPANMQSLDVQLPCACCRLLANLAASNPKACTWLLDNADRCVAPMVLLAFHPLVGVRSSVAPLLAVLAFLPEIRRWSGLPSTAGPPKLSTLPLPLPFADKWRLPLHTAPVGVDLGLVWDLTTSNAASGSSARQRMELQLSRLLDQRRLLRACSHDLRSVQLELERHDCAAAWPALPPWATFCMLHSLRALNVSESAAHWLDVVRHAERTGECHDALKELQSIAASAAGCAALSVCDWTGALERLLSSCPAQEEGERRLWCTALQLCGRIMAGGHASERSLVAAALHLGPSAMQWLRDAPVGVPAPRLPLALANGALPLTLAADPLERMLTNDISIELMDALRAWTWACCECLPQREGASALGVLDVAGLVEVICQHVLTPSGCGDDVRGAALLLLDKLLRGLQHCRSAGSSTVHAPGERLEAALLRLLRCVVSRVCVPLGAVRPSEWRGKHLLRCAVRVLLHVTCLLPAATWSTAWQRNGGTFWLSRFSRDHEPALRRDVALLVARLMAPAAHPTQRMLVQGWPDVGSRMMRMALDANEVVGARGAALRCLAAAMALPAEALQQQLHAQEVPSSFLMQRFGPGALLQQEPLWQLLPDLLCSTGGTGGSLACAVLALISQVLACDEERGAMLLEGSAAAALRILLLPQHCHSHEDFQKRKAQHLHLLGSMPAFLTPWRGLLMLPDTAEQAERARGLPALASMHGAALLLHMAMRGSTAGGVTSAAALRSAFPDVLPVALGRVVAAVHELQNSGAGTASRLGLRSFDSQGEWLGVLRHSVAACCCALQGGADAAQAVQSVEEGDTQALLACLSNVLLAPWATQDVRDSSTLLLHLLLVDAAAAGPLLHSQQGGGDAAERVLPDGQAVGGAVCAAVLKVVTCGALGHPYNAPAPVASAGLAAAVGLLSCTVDVQWVQGSHVDAVQGSRGDKGGDAVGDQQRPHVRPHGSSVGDSNVAPASLQHMLLLLTLRSLLVRSRAAKAVALNVGLHSLLNNCCYALAHLLLTHSAQRTKGTHKQWPRRCGTDVTASGKKGREKRLGKHVEAHQEGLHTCEQQELSPGQAAREQSLLADATASRVLVDRQAAAQPQLLSALDLLRHLASGDTPTRRSMALSGTAAVLHSLWPLAQRNAALLHALLALAHELLTGADAQVLAACIGGEQLPAKLLEDLLLLVCTRHVDRPTQSTASAVLRCVAANRGGTAVLLRAGGVELLASCIVHASSQRDWPSVNDNMQVLLNISAWPEGRKAVLTTSSIGPVVDVCCRVTADAANVGLAGACVALLRHLGFSSDAANVVAARPQLLATMFAAALRGLQGAGDALTAVVALHAIWALIYNAEKVKAMLRQVAPDAQECLTFVQSGIGMTTCMVNEVAGLAIGLNKKELASSADLACSVIIAFLSCNTKRMGLRK